MRISISLMRRYRFRNVQQPAPELTANIGKQTKRYANLPERYLVRKTAKVVHKSEDHPAYVPRLNKWEAQFHGLERPWTDHYWQRNRAFDYDEHPDIVQPISEQDWMWFKGDRVEIMTGEDKGKQGYICFIVQERNWVLVEGLNCEYKQDGESGLYPGFMTKKEKPLLVTTDIKLVDPSDEQSCDVEWQFSEDGERVRISTRTGYHLPIPTQADETVDYKAKTNYAENKEKDTKADVVEEITFEPTLATFEMDLMQKYGIKEDRIPRKTFWY